MSNWPGAPLSKAGAIRASISVLLVIRFPLAVFLPCGLIGSPLLLPVLCCDRIQSVGIFLFRAAEEVRAVEDEQPTIIVGVIPVDGRLFIIRASHACSPLKLVQIRWT